MMRHGNFLSRVRRAMIRRGNFFRPDGEKDEFFYRCGTETKKTGDAS
jgi:hypothetical protein